MRETWTWKTFANLLYSFRTWSRRIIWGDRVRLEIINFLALGLANVCQLFLQFHGPTTILLQSQASRLTDILSRDEVNEIAETPPGAVQAAVKELSAKDKAQDRDSAAASTQEPKAPQNISSAPRMSIASIGPDRKVTFEAGKEGNT